MWQPVSSLQPVSISNGIWRIINGNEKSNGGWRKLAKLMAKIAEITDEMASMK
jgi:hypothetical protein